jgi:antitoxin ParD1/3/4
VVVTSLPARSSAKRCGLEERDRLYELRLSELQRKLSVGVEQADRGELMDQEDVFAELEEDIRQIEAQRG